MRLRVLGDFRPNALQGRPRPPVPNGEGASGVQYEPWHVEWARFCFGADGQGSKTLFAPGAQLAERSAVIHSAGDIDDPWRSRTGFLDLTNEQGEQVARVQAVSDLVASTLEADVFQGFLGAP